MLHGLGAHTANDKLAGSRASDIVITPSAMRRSNSAQTAAGSPSTSYTAMKAWTEGGLPSTGSPLVERSRQHARDEACVLQVDVVVPVAEFVGASSHGVR